MDSTTAANAAYELVQDALLLPRERIQLAVQSLPKLDESAVPLEESCPICLCSFESILDEQQQELLSSARSTSSSSNQEQAKPDSNTAGALSELAGITKLAGCGHVFCRKDLIEWIRSYHGSCPTCRHTFLNISLPADDDDESSDGGEYVPDDDFEDEDEDGFIDIDDGFTEAEGEDEDGFGPDMDVDLAGIWRVDEGDTDMDEDYEDEESMMDDDTDADWGLTDGESESMSTEGDMSSGDRDDDAEDALEAQVSVSVHEDEENLLLQDDSSSVVEDNSIPATTITTTASIDGVESKSTIRNQD